MNLVFWGKEHQSGTTANFVVVAAMLRMLYGDGYVLKGRFLHSTHEVLAICDCGTGLTGRKRHFLRRADLVIVNLKASKACIDSFFQNAFCLTSNRVYVLTGYECEEKYVSYLMQNYRVERERIAWMPYNNVFQCAMERDSIETYIKKEWRQPSCLANEQFIDAAEKLVARILLNIDGKILSYGNKEE